LSDENAPAKEETESLDESPGGLQRRWLLRLNAARTALETCHEEGQKVVDEFLGKGKGSRLNLFFADVETKSANLSGDPKVRARRRYADARDDVARVSAMALDRVLNSDIERETDGYRKSLQNAKGDWLKPGLGQLRFRYVVKTEPTPAQAEQKGPCGCGAMTGMPQPQCPECQGSGERVVVPAQPAGSRKVHEDVETDLVKWNRFLWDPAEIWDDVQAVYYGLDLTKAQWEEQFPGKTFRAKGDEKGKKRDEVKEAFARAEVWEIWDKETRRVLFLSEQERVILKVVADPFGLPGFFPSPEPLAANVTTSAFVPRSTYWLAQEQYGEAHELQKRIRKLVKQVKVTGAYDGNSQALASILTDAADGKLYPVKNFASLVGKDGIANAISLLPIAETVNAIIALSERLALVKREIYEITGQSDIMRGQAAEKATATEQRIKARFGSSRIQADQDKLARFASDAQRIRAFLIAKLFDAETIAKRANIQPDSDDAQILPQAIELLKSSIADYRIDVDADSLSMTDFDAIQQENLALLKGSAEYFGAVAPLSVTPENAVFFAEIYEQAISGMRGSERFEPIIDRYVAGMKEKAKQPPAPPQPDPTEVVKAETEKVKAGAQVQKSQADIAKTRMDVQAKQAEHALKMRELAATQQVNEANFGLRMAEQRAKAEAAEDVAPGFEGGA
jgi:hypothetical protein